MSLIFTDEVRAWVQDRLRRAMLLRAPDPVQDHLPGRLQAGQTVRDPPWAKVHQSPAPGLQAGDWPEMPPGAAAGVPDRAQPALPDRAEKGVPGSEGQAVLAEAAAGLQGAEGWVIFNKKNCRWLGFFIVGHT